LKLSTTRLLVNDMKVSVAFYHETLGLPVRFADPDGEYTEFVVSEEVSLGLYSRAAMAEIAGSSQLPSHADAQDRFVITFVVDDVEAAAADLATRNLHPVVPITDRHEWMMRTVHYRDADGNLIEIHGNLPEAAPA